MGILCRKGFFQGISKKEIELQGILYLWQSCCIKWQNRYNAGVVWLATSTQEVLCEVLFKEIRLCYCLSLTLWTQTDPSALSDWSG